MLYYSRLQVFGQENQNITDIIKNKKTKNSSNQ